MKPIDTLADLRNHLYLSAERKWIASLLVAFGALVTTIVGLWFQATALIAVVGLVSVVTPIAVAWLRELASGQMMRADKCRRLMLYADSLGQAIPASQLTILRGWSLGHSLIPAPFVPPYFASRLDPGPQRLADNATEAAFFTTLLASKVEAALWVAFGAGLVVSITALLAADLASTISAPSAIAATKSVGVFICFLISGDFLVLARRFGALRSDARLAYEACSRLREEQGTILQEVIAICEDYDAAVLQTPPIPAWLYRIYRDDLNRLYRDSNASRKSGAG